MFAMLNYLISKPHTLTTYVLTDSGSYLQEQQKAKGVVVVYPHIKSLD